MPQLMRGDPAPWFTGTTLSRPDFAFNTIAGRYVAMCFVGSAADPAVQAGVDRLFKSDAVFDDQRASLLLVTTDPEDMTARRLAERNPGCRVFLDFERKLSAMYGAWDEAGKAYHRMTVVLDRNLRALEIFAADDASHAEQVLAFLKRQPNFGPFGLAPTTAPVLLLPSVFEPEFCRTLIGVFESSGGVEGLLLSRNPATGQLENWIDRTIKRRRDHRVVEADAIEGITSRFARRLFPEIRKVFQFDVKAADEYYVCCYDAAESGYFRPHRDNSTAETAARRFALTVNLNTEEYEGGDLRFLEFDSRTYRPPSGGAAVFSCSLLHEVQPVTRGRRYAVVTFFYG